MAKLGIVNGQADIFGNVSVTYTQHKKKKKDDDEPDIDYGRLNRNKGFLEKIDDILCCFKTEITKTVVMVGYDDPETAPIETITWKSSMNFKRLMELSSSDRIDFLNSLPVSSRVEVNDLIKGLFK